MKKFIHKNILSQTIFWSIINIVLILPILTKADELGGETTGTTLTNPLTAQSFSDLVASIAKLAAEIGIPIAAIFIIYSGLLFVTARGSEDQLKKAKINFMWAMIGTAILLGAWVIADAIATTVKSF
jgi:hypothetical protein